MLAGRSLIEIQCKQYNLIGVNGKELPYHLIFHAEAFALIPATCKASKSLRSFTFDNCCLMITFSIAYKMHYFYPSFKAFFFAKLALPNACPAHAFSILSFCLQPASAGDCSNCAVSRQG